MPEPISPPVGFRQDVTCLIPTFLRPTHAWQCLQTFRNTCPDVAIIVADQSDTPHNTNLANWCTRIPGAAYSQLPFDCGLAAARNALVRLATTEFVFFTDDDMVFAKEVFDIDRLIAPLKGRPNGKYDVAAARVRTVHGDKPGLDEVYEYNIRFFDEEPGDGCLMFARRLPADPELIGGTPVQRADTVANVFAARRDALLSVDWDITFKTTYEHYDWSMRCKMFGIRSGYATDMWAIHDKRQKTDQDPRYAGLRARFSKQDFFRKWGMRCFEIEGGLRMWREPGLATPHAAVDVTPPETVALPEPLSATSDGVDVYDTVDYDLPAVLPPPVTTPFGTIRTGTYA